MRLSIPILVAASGFVEASWIKLPGYRNLVGRGSFPPPRQTAPVKIYGVKGWTPKPTPAPGSVSESDAVLELLRAKRQETSYSWEDDTTCGWTSGEASAPFTCEPGASCRTNDANVVGCVSGTAELFFTVCLDMQAYEQGACASIGPQTGCCQTSGFGACGTYLWTGTPVRSMYRCFPTPTIISMNDEPQEVIDASLSTTSTTTSSSTSTSSTPPQTTVPDNGDEDKSSTPVGAIVGGVVGGVAALAILAGVAAWIILRRKRAAKSPQAYNAVSPDPNNPPPMATHQAPQQYPGGGGYTTVPGGTASTYPPTSPYPTSVSTATAYDQRQSYYDPNKSPGQVSRTTYPAPSPPVPVAGPYNPQHSVMSELESSARSGTRENPVEIGDK
ncbi:hypothetical protein GE09DRAFT_211367 [Coniochaeta sp. 2T2.1]|nr:hypothetical protein GE09DRAFT_211367 [Coniochaeta sp. 2T2.1]